MCNSSSWRPIVGCDPPLWIRFPRLAKPCPPRLGPRAQNNGRGTREPMDRTRTLEGARSLERTVEEGRRFARAMYLPRVLGIGAGMVCVAGGLWEAAAPFWEWILLAANGVLWPHLAYRLARHRADPYRAELRNLMVDSACGGAWMAAIGFSIVPSAVMF